MAEVNLLKAQSMFAKVQYQTIDNNDVTFTVPTHRTIKIVKFHLNKLDTGSGDTTDLVRIFIADTGAAIWQDYSGAFNTSEGGTGTPASFIFNDLLPITLSQGQWMRIIGESAVTNCQCWISYEEYSESATTTSASGFTVS